jgi:hypothetical protein
MVDRKAGQGNSMRSNRKRARRSSRSLGLVGWSAWILVLAPVDRAQESPQVDWRSRGDVGRDVLLEFEFEERSSHRKSGGGNAYQVRGTIRDRVFVQEGEDAIGVRLVTRTNGTETHSEVAFFRTRTDGRTEDDTPLAALIWPHWHELPFSDPVGAAADLAPGLDRERDVELQDPEFRSIWPHAVRVRETVLSVPDLRWNERVLARSWKASDETGLLDPAGRRALLALEDRCRFHAETGVIVERAIAVSFLSPPSSDMRADWSWTIREVAAHSESFSPPSADEGLELRRAFRLARARPREALALFSAWSPSRPPGMSDVAAQVWLLAKGYEARLDGLLKWQLGQLELEGWGAVGLSVDDAAQAVWDGRATAAFEHAGLEAGRHRDALRRRWAAEGRGERAIRVLEQLHEAGCVETGGELERQEGGLSAGRRREAAEWFEARMEELSR